jgi:hypothetical protein
MAGLSALARAFPTLPPVALAPGGTVCTVAKNLECWGPRGVRDKVCVRAERVVTAACRGAARVDRRPTLRVRDDTGGDRLGFIFGAGLVTRFFDVYYDAPRSGLGSAARIAAAVLGGSFVGSRLARRVLEPVRCSLVVGGEPHPSRAWSLVLASVVRDVGLHFLATYRGGEELERFHVVASGLPPRALAPQLPRVLAGRPLAGEPRVDSLARSLSVAFEDADGYVLDGELLRAAEVHVDVGPVISVLSPPPEDSA